MSTSRIAIFASGTGTNARAIIQFFQDDPTEEVVLVVTNKPDAGVIDVASTAGIEYAIITKPDLQDEELMMAILEEYKVNTIILAGWLLLVPSYLVKAFEGRILNIHPALLPKFGGKGMWGKHVHKAVKDANEMESGITVHLVNEHYDEGAIIAQHRVGIEEKDDADDIERKVRALELEYYPKEIKKYLDSI